MKRLLLSGATSGIGHNTCEHFCRLGYEVITLGRCANGIEAGFIECDFSDGGSVEQAAKKMILERPFNAFINCAGLLPGKDFKEYDADGTAELFNINVFSPISLVKALLNNSMLKKNGAIILVSSISAFKGSYDEYYAASKGAINSFIKSLATKIAPEYRIVGVAPGMTERTRMTDQLVEGRFEHNLKLIPTGHPVQPEELSALFEYIIEHGKSMTGNVVDINGGQYLR